MNVFDDTLKKCDIYKAHLELAINGLKTNDCSVPLELLPVENNYKNSKNPWDIWESEKYRSEMVDINKYWNKCLSAARKINKHDKKQEFLSKRRKISIKDL